MKWLRRWPATWRDAVLVVIGSIVTAALCIRFDVSEALQRWTAPWERFQLDELLPISWVAVLGLAWYAARRHAQARRELGRRQQTEQLLRTALSANRRLAQQSVQRQESERKSLARELHDELGQYLNVIKLDAVQLRDEPAGKSSVVRARAAAIIDNSNHIHASLTGLVRQLRPVGLDELGLAAALEDCIDGWRSRLPQAQLSLAVSCDLTDLDETRSLTLYRLVQEALTNVAKHARATRISVRLDRSALPQSAREALSVTISDDGAGTDPQRPTTGMGILGMRERVAAFDGHLAVSSAPGAGFRLQAEIPLPDLQARSAD